jgi:hypothetical protein
MISLKMEKQCGCFKRSSFDAEQSYNTKEEALKEAKNICVDMNSTFCQKHVFNFIEEDNDVVIKMGINK